MQLIHDHQAIMTSVKEVNHTIFAKDPSSDQLDVKERRSSNASLLLMNPVASGDNMATGLNSTHKLKEELPPLVPCCEGRELQINEDLVRSGLSAISVKHGNVIQSLSLSHACEKLQVAPGLVKHRNSFRCLHRPDLKRVPYLRRLTPDELELLFRGSSDVPSFVASRSENQDEITKIMMPPEENLRNRDLRTKENCCADDANAAGLHPIPETRSGAEDVPIGMRLHGARARLYTSVLAGTKAGDHLDGESLNEEYDARVPVDIVPEDEVQLNEELQIILPPRCDDTAADSSTSSTLTDNSTS
ncbi:hypothetical protein MSG28_011197 [Choristoneura fumiferana]|uniref:Uncharacterized protein n=1 Tax=Choristoneura fumiferana TaxID=7141 RepID=A0ACC0KR73_CHOFU|nr:hypothetical protein MSG28_011197 [Choristoneura fumiferana]